MYGLLKLKKILSWRLNIPCPVASWCSDAHENGHRKFSGEMSVFL